MYRLPQTASFPLDPIHLASERGRLVRFCARNVGSTEVAEDLAQEAMMIAWQRRATLRDADLWQAWLNGIARNVCLRYLRRIGTERERLVSADGEQATVTFDTLPDTSLPDLNELLEQDDIARLLDRAMRSLPHSAQHLLTERYLYDMSIEEIAARRGVREETATVQLYRSRQALKRVLTDSKLAVETAALGLIDGAKSEWQETRLWCPDCGMHRLEGFFCYYDTNKQHYPLNCHHCGNMHPCPCDHQAGRQLWLSFALRCPHCIHTSVQEGSSPSVLVHMSNATMLQGVKGFKPALNRINRWWHEHIQSLIRNGSCSCMRCGYQHVPLQTQTDATFPWSLFREKAGAFTLCPRCGSASAIEVHEIARQTLEGQRFWQQVPRFRTLSPQRVDSVDGPLLVTRLESITNSQALEIALHAQTMEVSRIVRIGVS